MTWKNIEYNKTKLFSKLSLDYISKKAHFSDLITDFPSIDNFKNQPLATIYNTIYNNNFRNIKKITIR